MNRFNEAFTIVLAVVVMAVDVVGAEAFVAPSTSGVTNAYHHGNSLLARRRASFYYPEDDGRYSDNYYEYDDASSSSSSSSTTIAPPASYDPSTFFFGGTLGHGGGDAPSPPPPSSERRPEDFFFLDHHSSSGHDYDYGGLLGMIAAGLPASTLARLASAYSPPGRDIDVTHVNDARCVNLDGDGIEIEAVVCDSMECASLLVPVNFPEGCEVAVTMTDDYRHRRPRAGGGGGGGGAVVVGGGGASATATRRGRHGLHTPERREIGRRGGGHAQGEEGGGREDVRGASIAGGGITGGGGVGGGGGGTTSSIFSSLGRGGDGDDDAAAAAAELPDWWEMPIADEDASECDLMRRVLNGEDMRDMVLELAAANLAVDGGRRDVRDARVDAVGPAGMVLRARLSAVVDGGSYDDEDDDDTCTTLTDVHVRFADVISSRQYSGSIRQRVLALFS